MFPIHRPVVVLPRLKNPKIVEELTRKIRKKRSCKVHFQAPLSLRVLM